MSVQSSPVQVCSLCFPGAGSMNERSVWGVLLHNLCDTFTPLSVKKQKLIVHTGKGLPTRVCLCLSIHLMRVVRNLTRELAGSVAE